MTETKRELPSDDAKRAKQDGREHPRDPEPAEGPLLEVRGLQKHFPIKGGAMRRVIGQVKAVDGVSLSVDRRETVAIVGESGCGKSTTGRTIIRLEEPTGGEVIFRHPELGPVTLGQHLATWVAHDLDHIVQIARTLAKQYSDEVGPWRAYLRIISGAPG